MERAIMRIAYVTSYFPNLTTTFVLNEMLSIQKLGHEVFVLPLSGKKYDLDYLHEGTEQLLAYTFYANIRSLQIWHCFLAFIFKQPLLFLSLLSQIVIQSNFNPFALIKGLYPLIKAPYFSKIVLDRKIQHIHADFASLPATGALLIAQISGKPFSFTCHAVDIFATSMSIRNELLSWKLEAAKFVISEHAFGSRFLIKKYGEHFKEKITVIRTGINIDKFQFHHKDLPIVSDKNTVKILCIGRLISKKGYKYLIDACHILSNKGIALECTIVGDGPLKTELVLQISKLKLESVVKFHPPVPQQEILFLYQNADIFVLPCITAEDGDMDGIPTVLIEAAAVGIPIISTPISGIPELIADNITGRLVAASNSEALAGAIEQAILQPSENIKKVKKAREWVEAHFDTKKNVQDLVKLLETTNGTI